MYQFDTQLGRGMDGERRLDAFFARLYDITPATKAQQLCGKDRTFTCLYFGKQFTVEYKTDYTAARTGNAFVETVSVSTTGKQGWVYTATAEYLVYYIPKREVVYVIRFDALRLCLPQWLQTCLQRDIPNRGYYSRGVLVPLVEFDALTRPFPL